ncbi:MAG: SdpI family protein [Rhodospirillaceae bacterium]|nr:SdpI family protein [Rhodospirillaceae bacterium]
MEKAFRIGWGLIALSALIAIGAYAAWPGGSAPVRFDTDGTPLAYGSAFVFFFFIPAAMIATMIVMRFITRSEPARENLEKSSKAFMASLIGMLIVMILAQLFGTAAAYGLWLPVPQLITTAAGLLLAVIGNYMPKARRNFTLGVRNRWTLSSDEIWQKTHRFSAPLMIIAGLAMIVLPWLMQFKMGVLLAVIAILGVATMSYVYSYCVWVQVGRPELN